jgi:hypothetical protein
MQKNYFSKSLLFILASLLVLIIASCKKDKPTPTPTPKPVVVDAIPKKIDLIGYGGIDDGTSINNLYIGVSQVGTKDLGSNNISIFDSGSGGMVIDGTEVLPASMVTSTGFTFTGDSTIVNGITITNQVDTIEFGDDSAVTKVYGNLAYAPITLGDAAGNVVIKRAPFFVYYDVKTSDGSTASQGDFDVVGVSSEYDFDLPDGFTILSPFTYYSPGTGLTDGFKLAVLDTTEFTNEGGNLKGALTLGLTKTDLSSASGFLTSTINSYQGIGYLPIIQTSITYNSITFSSLVLFDTGTSAPLTFLESSKATKDSIGILPANIKLTLNGSSGFSYTHTTNANDLFYVENPSLSGTTVSIFGLQFFFSNEYMLDYTDHTLGLKNN